MMKSEQKGVYSKLQNVSVPWDEKLTLARYVWDSPDCVIPNKQQVLIDWIIQGLLNRSKKDPQIVQVIECKGLWELLFHVLQSHELLSQEKIPVTLKPPLLQVPFLSSLLSFFESVSLEQSEQLYILVKACLQKFLVFQRQQVNQRKVFAVMCQQLLKPLIRLVFCLDGVRSQEQNKDHISEYQMPSEMSNLEKDGKCDEPAKKKPKIYNYTKLFLDKLREFVSDSAQGENKSGSKTFTTQEAVLAMLPFLFKEFVVSSRKANPSEPKMREFNFFTEVCGMLGLCDNTRQDVPSVCGLLHQVLECVHVHDIYQVADDSWKGSLQFDWLKKLVDVLIRKGGTSEAMFQCLDVLLKLNHSLLEPHLEAVWVMLWKTGSSKIVAHGTLMFSLTSTYSKLRQFDKLVSAILDSLRTVEVSALCLTPMFKKKQSQKESAFFSILLLQYTLTELEIYLRKFHVVESDGEESETLLPSVTWSEEMDDFVPAKSTRVVKKDQCRLLYLKNALCIQNIRFILLNEKDSDHGNELPKLVSCVCSSIDAEAPCNASWDGQELTISVENASVALWDLISRNAVVLFALCNTDQQLTLAQILIKTLLQAKEGHETLVAGSITMYDISMAMIQVTSFHEVLSMQTATVCAIWGAIKHCIDSSCIGGSLVERLSTVLNQIKTLEFSSDAEVNEEQTANDDNQDECDEKAVEDDNEPMSHDNDQVKWDEEKMEDEEVADYENGSSEEESDSDNEWSKMQEEQQLREFKAFYALGCAVSEVAKTALFSEVGDFSAADCLKPLKVFGCLPLDWLSYGNCARCLIGHFACDVIFTTTLLKDCSAELTEPLLQNRQLLTVLFDGCVRRKRFIAHDVIDIESLHNWLLSSTTQLWQKFHTDPHRKDALYDMLRISRGLMNSTVKYLLKASTNYSCKGIVRKALSDRISSSRIIQVSSAIVINLGPSLLTLLTSIAQASKRKQAVSGKPTSKERNENEWDDVSLEFSFLIDSFTCLLNIYAVSQQSRYFEFQFITFSSLIDYTQPACTFQSCLRFLASVCQSSSKLSLHVPEDFHVRLLASSLQFLKLHHSEKTRERGANLSGTENGDHDNVLVSANQRKDPVRRDISEEGYDLVLSLLEGCERGLLPQLLEGLCSGMTVNTINKESMELLYVSLHIWHLLLSKRFITDRREEFRPKLSEVLLALQFFVQEHKTRNLEIVQLAAGITNKILSLGKGMIFSGNARLVLHSGLMVTLEDCDNRLYQEISFHKGKVSKFSQFSPYLIADYIHTVQTVAIPPAIREALVPGVYCLLDICGEHELSLLHAVLEKGCQELFHSLHADYSKYHKFKGKI
ncbi:Unhealthy ribosome biogenesis protein 2-like protein [Acropora cervicornis]|uniref:Unhealthy ribosome biogenesis protein 2-like protein n=1 Tax=Acropora cervicornis TaxID=6130 RepID=A0AAD9Q696_ACRCE|nr:Unhealthy ribosome biogenesis protein 2-like protein [Acropora cervicornis]